MFFSIYHGSCTIWTFILLSNISVTWLRYLGCCVLGLNVIVLKNVLSLQYYKLYSFLSVNMCSLHNYNLQAYANPDSILNALTKGKLNW